MFAALLIGPATAQATAYRYWTYWTVGEQGAWKFSQVGPAATRPGDGSVEGWRFALSTGTRGQGAQPRITPEAAFRQFCANKTAPSGQKRVAVVFDFGSSEDAPPGQLPPPAKGTCVVIAADATGGEVLAEAADVRLSDGMVCAIGGYPQGECAPAVADPSPTPASTGKSRNPDRSQPDKKPRPAEQPPADDSPADPPPANNDKNRPADKAPTSQQQPKSKPKQAPAPLPTGVPGGTTAAGASPDGVVPAAPLPAVPSTSATAAPVFTEAEAREASNDSGPARALLGIALLAGLVGVIGWRRASRGSS